MRLDYKTYSDDLHLSESVSKEINSGRVVVLSGHPYKGCDVNLDELRLRFNFTKAQPVVCLG